MQPDGSTGWWWVYDSLLWEHKMEIPVEMVGFKKFEKRDIKIFANDRADVGAVMEIGSVSDTVTVEASTSAGALRTRCLHFRDQGRLQGFPSRLEVRVSG
jgi:hypothetical protein